jgi:hypothetical protein
LQQDGLAGVLIAPGGRYEVARGPVAALKEGREDHGGKRHGRGQQQREEERLTGVRVVKNKWKEGWGEGEGEGEERWARGGEGEKARKEEGRVGEEETDGKRAGEE